MFIDLEFRLYQAGWHYARRHRQFHISLHLLLSLFYFYRLGYCEARQWTQVTIKPIPMK